MQLQNETEMLVAEIAQLLGAEAAHIHAIYLNAATIWLWDIAKKFYTTVDEISGVNSLTEKEVKPGQSLILVRQG